MPAAVLGAARNGAPLKQIWARVIAAVILCVGVVVVLQSLGIAPAMEVVR